MWDSKCKRHACAPCQWPRASMSERERCCASERLRLREMENGKSRGGRRRATGRACNAKKAKKQRRRRRRQRLRRQNQRENNNCYTCFGNARKGWKQSAQHTTNGDGDSADDKAAFAFRWAATLSPPSHQGKSERRSCRAEMPKCRSTENRAAFPMKPNEPMLPLAVASRRVARYSCARVRTDAARMSPRCKYDVGVNEAVDELWVADMARGKMSSRGGSSCCKGQFVRGTIIC